MPEPRPHSPSPAQEIKNVPVKSQIVNMASSLQAYAAASEQAMATAVKFLLDCAAEIAPKVPAYAGIVAALVAKGEDQLSAGIVRQASERLAAALTAGDHAGARPMLRLLGACAAHGAVDGAAVVAVMEAIVNAAGKCAEANAGKPHTLWQPYSDSLVRITLLALPFLAPGASEEGVKLISGLLGTAGTYMGLRAAPYDKRFAPLSSNVDGSECTDDSGSYSLTGETFAAVGEVHAAGRWGDVHSVQLFRGELSDALAGIRPLAVELAAVDVPLTPPGIDAEFVSMARERENQDAANACRLTDRYGPRGSMRILDRSLTQGDSLALERLLFEDYVVDILTVWHDDRVECVKRLATLPIGPERADFYGPCLAEAAFGQLLRLPLPHHKTVAYLGVMVDLCRLKTIPFARAMSACMRELFRLAGVLHPALLERLAEYLAYHLSAFDFIWPWDRWAHVARAPPRDPQRKFCTLVLDRILRLSYFGKLMDTVPREMDAVRPPEPTLVPIRPPGVGDAQLEPAARRAMEVAEMARSKAPEQRLGEWLASEAVAADLGSPAAVAGAALRGVLEAGAKSITHMVVLFDRYVPAIVPAVEAAGQEAELACIAAATAAWARSPQRLAITLERLMGMRLVGPAAILRWCVEQAAAVGVDDPLAHAHVWRLLHSAMDRMVARTGDCRTDVDDAREYLGRQRGFLEQAEAALAEALAARDAGEGEWQGDPTGEAVENCRGRVGAAQGRVEEAEAALEEYEDGVAVAEEEERGAVGAALAAIVALFGAADAMPAEPPMGLVNPAAVTDPGFAARSAEGPAPQPPVGPAEARSLEARQLLGRLREFCLRYAMTLAGSFDAISRETVAEGHVAPAVRQAVLGTFVGL